ncbi:MAG: hypothetical protein OEW46_02190 [Actinomycetota bacterium]|nr:hypothetical protein [Actinomycetota bacterium]
MNETNVKGDRIVDAPEIESMHLDDRVDGPAAAVMLSAGIGIFVLGLLTLLAEANVSIHDFLGELEFDKGVGPLAGKTILASAGFFVSWLVLGLAMRHKEVDLRRWFWIAFALGVIGAVLMFPPVFQAFASE